LEKTVYRQLLRINRGFDAVVRGLAVLRDHGGFHSSELRRFRTWLRKYSVTSTLSQLGPI
jgi:hypothetical protein